MNIEWETPPNNDRGGRYANKTQRFVAALKERPGEWAVYSRTYKAGTSQSLRKACGPGVEFTVRRNPDYADTRLHTVYGRWIGES